MLSRTDEIQRGFVGRNGIGSNIQHFKVRGISNRTKGLQTLGIDVAPS
jgi:hypothetical protein